jgi:hypothetical protein
MYGGTTGNTLLAYVSSSGQYVQVSDRELKHSLRNKTIKNTDYLERIKKLNIYSYCFKNEN